MAYSFDPALSQYLSVSSPPVTTTPLSMACWIYIPAHTNLSRSILHLGPTNANGYRAQITSTNRIQLLQVGNVNGTVIQIDATAATGQWISVCGVFSSFSSRSLYIDGALQGTNTTTITSMDAVAVAYIGARQLTTMGQFFSGFIADFGLWSVALSADEIASLAKGMACSKIRPQSLVFYAPLVRNLVNVSNNLTITNNNSATVANHTRIYY